MSGDSFFPYEDAAAVTPSDTTAQYTSPAGGLIVQVSGTVKLITSRGSIVTIGAAAGVEIHLAWLKIFATGTSATGIVALIGGPFKAWQ